MKQTLNAYYELTVIPAIVLGCLTSLIQMVFSFIHCGIAFVSPEYTFNVIMLFLVIMTVESIYDKIFTAPSVG